MNIPVSKFRLTSLVGTLALLALGSAAQAQSPVPTFSKSFTPATIGPGSVSTLRFDIANGTGLTVTDLAFTDNLPAAVTIADPAAVTTTCQDAAVSAPAGGGTISLSGARLGAGASCLIRVNVTSATPGTHTNTSGNLTSSAGNSGTATADLTVATDRPGFRKSFDPDTVAFGGRSTLTFTIDNSANGSTAFDLTFTDNLPSGMVIASPANRSKTCVGGTFSAPAGGTVISYAPTFFGLANDADVAAGASCTLSVDVLGSAVGSLGNTSGELTSRSTTSGTDRSSGKAGATLTVLAERLSLTKTFVNDPVPPGGTVNLQFTLRNLDRAFQATDIEFTDDLDAVVSGLAATDTPLTDPCGAGSSLTGTGVLSLTGGTLEVGASCTFSVTLQVPAGAPSGSFTNTTSTVEATADGQPVGGAAATDVLFIEPAPVLSKEFTDDPVGAGETVTLEFTITNTSQTSDATDITFSDEFVVELPTASSVPADGFCGAGSTATYTPAAGNNLANLVVSGASLGPGASCTFSLSLDVAVGSAAGLFTNTTSDISATVDGATVTGNPASDDLQIIGAPALTKEFTDDPATPGGSVTLEFTIRHDESAPADASDITFSDDLDAALSGLVATGLPLTDVCGTGSQIDGTMTLLFTGGTLAPGESCTFSVTLQVPGTAPSGSHTNTTSAIAATVLGVTTMADPAVDDLRIAGLTLTKEFIDDPVLPGGTVTLRFTIDNVTSASTATDISFQDDLDNVISNLAAIGLPLADVCGTGSSLIGTSGNRFLTFQNGTLGPGESCSFDVVLQVPASAAPDQYSNLTSNFRATIGGSTVSFDNARDDLVLAADFLALSKEFTDDPASPGGTVNLRFTLTNLDPVNTVDNVAFTDDLDAALSGLEATGLPVSACGGTVSGTSVISFSGGILLGGETCSFDVTLGVPAAVSLGTIAVNLSSQATGTIGGLDVVGDPATDELVINVLNFVKSFDADATAGGTVGLTFSIENLSSSEGISDLQFSDDLDAVIAGLVATGLPAADVCGAGSLLTGTSVLTLTGGNLLPGGSCTFSVTLSVPGDAEPGDYLNTTSSLRTSTQGEVADGASATLTVISVDDSDGDGVLDNADVCPDTVIPEGVPTQSLGVNRYALVDDDFIFDTTPPPGGGNGPGDVFTTTDTAGCSCEQIIDELGLGQGHRKFGCSVGVMRNWVRQVTPVFLSGFESG